LFTLAIVARNRGFLAIGDWLKAYRNQLITLFQPPKERIPSYSTIRRVLLEIDYQVFQPVYHGSSAFNPYLERS
jgi:hypothetical protein